MKWDEWRFSAKRAWQDPFIKWTTIGTVLLYLAMTAFALRQLLPQGIRTGILTMHYTIYLGIDDVRPWQWIFLLPGALLSILMMNGAIACGVYRQDELAAKTLIALSLIVTLLWSISLFFLIAVNL